MTLDMAIKALEILKKAACFFESGKRHADDLADGLLIAYSIITNKPYVKYRLHSEIAELEAMIEGELNDD